jgi:hypothetical protein
MCDHCSKTLARRLSKKGDLLISQRVEGIVGFRAHDDPRRGRQATGICIHPGATLSFTDLSYRNSATFPLLVDGRWRTLGGRCTGGEKTARFVKINLDIPSASHDALELPSGALIPLNSLLLDQITCVMAQPLLPEKEAPAATAVVYDLAKYRKKARA